MCMESDYTARARVQARHCPIPKGEWRTMLQLRCRHLEHDRTVIEQVAITHTRWSACVKRQIAEI